MNTGVTVRLNDEYGRYCAAERGIDIEVNVGKNILKMAFKLRETMLQ